MITPTTTYVTNPENDRSLGKLIFSLNQKLSPTVFFISCNTEKLRKRLYIAITAETTRFKHIHIDLTPHSVYSLRDAISKFVPDEVKQSPQLTYVVHFTGISSSLFTSEDGEFKKSMLLEEMNFEREILFQDYPFISVLWMTPYFLKELFWKAGDLMSWVFDYYEFTDDSPEAITNKIPYNKPLSKLSAYAERIERIKELENLVESLDEQDVDPKKVMLNQLNAYLLLGQEYMEAFKWKEAETNLLKAKSIAEKTSIDSHSYYISLLNLSSLYRNIKNYEKAIFYLEQILKVIGNLYINSAPQRNPAGVFEHACLPACLPAGHQRNGQRRQTQASTQRRNSPAKVSNARGHRSSRWMPR